MPPLKAPALFTRMPKLSPAAEILPWLLMPPANVGTFCTRMPLTPAEITPLLLTVMPAKATALVTWMPVLTARMVPLSTIAP
jgi:hypothetical protein